jgi:alkylhydroperoxidase family enzyme
MPRIDVPDGQDPLTYVWTELAPDLTTAAGRYSHAVYEKSRLSIREFEAARITVARINDCAICTNWRTARDVPSRGLAADAVPEAFYAQVGRAGTAGGGANGRGATGDGANGGGTAGDRTSGDGAEGERIDLTERERLAAEFAARYATDHRRMDADLWDRLHAVYTDDELVDLALCVASWLALGRFNQVFDIDGACRVP